jgi:hypothetical protein
MMCVADPVITTEEISKSSNSCWLKSDIIKTMLNEIVVHEDVGNKERYGIKFRDDGEVSKPQVVMKQ